MRGKIGPSLSCDSRFDLSMHHQESPIMDVGCSQCPSPHNIFQHTALGFLGLAALITEWRATLWTTVQFCDMHLKRSEWKTAIRWEWRAVAPCQPSTVPASSTRATGSSLTSVSGRLLPEDHEGENDPDGNDGNPQQNRPAIASRHYRGRLYLADLQTG